MRTYSCIFSLALLLFSCTHPETTVSTEPVSPPDKTIVKSEMVLADTANAGTDDGRMHPDTKNVNPEELVSFAQTLTGIPYKYACSDPSKGFDCSGFITYVFNHFHISVPRSSVDFTNAGKEVPVKEAKAGDLILFTGTDSTIRVVGHMGIVTSNESKGLEFIHSTSGKAYSVTTTPLNSYYQGRFVKVIRVFKQNDLQL